MISQILNEIYHISKDIRVELNEKIENKQPKIEKLFNEKHVNYTNLD